MSCHMSSRKRLQTIVSSSLPMISSNILRERRVKRARVLCRVATNTIQQTLIGHKVKHGLAPSIVYQGIRFSEEGFEI